MYGHRQTQKKPQLSKFESYKAANTKEVQFRLKFCVVLLIDTYLAAAARRSGRTCRLFWGAWVLVNVAKALGPQEGS